MLLFHATNGQANSYQESISEPGMLQYAACKQTTACPDSCKALTFEIEAPVRAQGYPK
jgi:hypothetical protein